MVMSQIVACRTELSDRFPVASFAVRVPSKRYFEVAFATDPRLFHPEASGRRTAANFYSSRSSGLMRAPAGEATYLLPSGQLRRFAGKRRLYYALATYGSPRGEDVQTSADLSHLERLPFVRLASSFSGRSLERSRLMGVGPAGHDIYGGRAPTLTWGGDLQAQETVDSGEYSDGYDPALWREPASATAGSSQPMAETGYAGKAAAIAGDIDIAADERPLVEASADVAEVPHAHHEAYGSVEARADDGDEEEPGMADDREDGDIEDEAQALSVDADADDVRDAELEDEAHALAEADAFDNADALEEDQWSASKDDAYVARDAGDWDSALNAGPGWVLQDDVHALEDDWQESGSEAAGSYPDEDSDEHIDEPMDAAADADWDQGLGDSGSIEEEPQQDDYGVDDGYAGADPDQSTGFLPPEDDLAATGARMGGGLVALPADPPGAHPLDPLAKAQLLYAVSDLHGKDQPFTAWSVAENGGLRFGVGDLDQCRGSLGAWLQSCRDEDQDAFAQFYGDAWQELLDITNAPDEVSRLGPVAGLALTEPKWTDRFVRAGGHRPFQRAQLKTAAAWLIDPILVPAARLGLYRDRALAALVDRTQRLGTEAAVAEVADMLCPVKRANLRGGDTSGLDETLASLGYGDGGLRERLEAFQADAGVDEGGRFGAGTQVALVSALRDSGQLDRDSAATVQAVMAYGGQDRLMDTENPYLSDRDYALAEFA
jgi:hypothetical protein